MIADPPVVALVDLRLQRETRLDFDFSWSISLCILGVNRNDLAHLLPRSSIQHTMPVLEAPAPPLASSSKLTNGHHASYTTSNGDRPRHYSDETDHDAMSVVSGSASESEEEDDEEMVEVHGESALGSRVVRC